MNKMGVLLTELRRDFGMTQKNLAKKIHVSVGTISNYEKGVHNPDVDKLMDLADIFNVTTDYLLGRCVSRFSPDVFTEAVAGNVTADDLIKIIKQLTPNHRDALLLILDDMKFRMDITRFSEKERR